MQDLRVRVQRDTLDRLRRKPVKPYFAYATQKPCRPGYAFLDPDVLLPRGPCARVFVVELDTFVAAEECLRFERGPVAVLNMASAEHPGGGYKFGASAQEEDLCRRSDTVPVLEAASAARMYPIPTLGMLVIPEVDVIKGPRPEYATVPRPFRVGMIVAAALKNPEWTAAETLRPEDADVTVKKMKMVLAGAYAHGFKTLVLGAWGCGAYHNPPAHIAALFKAVLKTHGAGFERVVFAVVGDGNQEIFAKVFSTT